jgi:hypothetical protein
MIWKTYIILIYFFLSISAGFGLIHSGIQQADNNAPNQNGVNIANINGGTGYINQNINQNCLVDSYQSASMKLVPVSGIGFNEHASYTINFFNINYGLLRDKSKDPLHRSRLQHYPPSMKEALRLSAENARILEKDRKENIELLKRIAS